MANGYFQLVDSYGGYGLKIYKPTLDGERVRINEVTDYLSFRNIICDLSVLKDAIASDEDKVILLGDGPCPKEDGTYFLTVSDDGMSVTARFYAPSEKGEELGVNEFIKGMNARQIKFGIRTNAIMDALNHKVYCTDVIVANGMPARNGTDASIEYLFNTDLRAHPTQREDGSVDFFHLNNISHCHSGDVLARLTPVDPGDYGQNVYGTRIKPRDVKNTVLRYGRNIQISEDKLTLVAMVDGHVTLVEDKVFVSDVYIVENVDNSTGNIEFAGSVQINGNVQSNFKVAAQGNIIVNGVVEGAYLEAGGDIVIARGMNGMAKGTLKAGGNIIVKFLENAKALAGGYIHAESMLHSEVVSGCYIMVEGKKGFITGGRVCATQYVEVKTLGSSMGASTIVEVGTDPEVKQKLLEAQKKLTEATKTYKSLEPIIANFALKKKQGARILPEQMKYMMNVIQTHGEKKKEIEELLPEIESLTGKMMEQSSAKVIVKGEVFPGTKIAIGDVSTIVQTSLQYCRFEKIRGDVKVTGI